MARKTPKYGNWVKNFGSSVKFASKDVLTELAPSIAGTTSGMAADVRELKQTIKKLRKDKRAIVNYIIGEDENVSKYAGEALKNLKHGLKTGDMYDPARSEKLLMKSMGLDDLMDGFDDNSDDFNFDESDAGAEDQDISSVNFGPAKVFAATGAANIKALGGLNTSINNGTATMAKGFSELDKSNKKSMAISIALNEKFFNNTAEKLDAVNNNLVTMVEFNNQTMSTFVQGSLKYYDDSLAVMNGMLSALNRLAPERAKKEAPGYNGAMDQIMNGDGFSLMGYAKTVAKNSKSAFQDSPLGLLTLINNPMFMADFAANPMGMLMGEGIKQLIPASLRKSMKGLNSHFKSFIPALLNKIGGYSSSDNPLLSMFGQLFGVKSKSIGNKYDSSNYEHGSIVWDGEAKKALTEVIPGYLELINYNIEKIVNRDHPDRARKVMWNWESGKFNTRENEERYNREKERYAALSGMDNVKWSLHNGTNMLNNKDDRDRVNGLMDELLANFVMNNKHINMHNKDDVEYIRKFLKGKTPANKKNPNQDNYDIITILSLLKNLPPDLQMELNTSGIFAGADAVNRYRQGRNGTGGSSATTAASLNNNLHTPGHGNDRNYLNSEFRIYKDDDGKATMSDEDLERANAYFNRRNAFNITGKKNKGESRFTTKFKNAEQVLAAIKEENKKFDGRGLSEKELAHFISKKDQVSSDVLGYRMEKNRSEYSNDDDNTISGALGKLKPVDWLNKGIGHLDKMMYDIIFGTGKEPSIFMEIIKGIKNTFRTTKDWLVNNIFNPIKIALFGEDIAKSKWFQDLKEGVSTALVGAKGKDGKYEGGVFSGIRNMFTDLFSEVGHQWKTYMLPMFNDMGGILKEYIFGEEKDKNKPKVPIMDKIMGTLQEGFGAWSDILFGGGNGRGKNAKRSGALAAKEFREAIPSTIRGGLVGATVGTISGLGGFGVLGSLFLPGGPIGGAIVGSAISLLHRSEAFKDMLYGKEDKKTGERSGGIITKNTQDFFKKHKVPLIGGAMMGTASYALTGSMGFGIIPSIAISAFGPVLMGAAWGYALHAGAIKDALFGKKDDKGNRTGAIISKSTQSFMRKAFPRAAVGALGSMAGFGVMSQMGIIGSMAAFGPIPAAIMGAGLGIASASTGFTRKFFGYYDEKTGEYHSGALDRIKNFFTLKLFKPLGLKIEKEIFGAGAWLKKNVAYPIADAFVPIKVLMKKTGHEIYTYISDIFKKIGKDFNEIFGVIMKRVNTIFKVVLTPLQKMANGMLSIFKSVTGGFIKGALMPLRVMGNLASLTIKGQAYKNAVGKAYGGLKNAMNTGGLGDIAKSAWHFGGSLINTDAAMENDEYASEITKHEREAAERDAKLEEETGLKKSYFQEQQAKLKKAQELFAKNGWDNSSDMNKEIADRIKTQRNAAMQAEIASKSNDPALNIAGQQLEQTAGINTKMDDLIKAVNGLTADTKQLAVGPDGELVQIDNPADKLMLEQEKDQNSRKNKDVVDAEEAKANAAQVTATLDALYAENAADNGGHGRRVFGLPGVFSDPRNSDNNVFAGAEEKREADKEAKKDKQEQEKISIWKQMLNTLGGAKNKVKNGIKNSAPYSILSGIGSIFGGVMSLLTMGSWIAMGVMAIPLFLKWMFGDRKAGGGLDRAAGSNGAGNIFRKIVGFGAKHVLGTGVKLGMAAGRTGMSIGRAAMGAGNTFMKNARFGAMMSKYGSKAGASTIAGKIGGTEIGQKIIEKIDKVESGVITIGKKISGAPKNIIEGLFKSLKEWVSSDSVGSIASRVTKSEEFKHKIVDVIGELIKKLSKADVWAKFMSIAKKSTKILGAIGRTIGGTAVPVVGQIAIGALAVYDGITGFLDADKMFDVASEDVDWKMRLISTAINVFCNLPYVNVLDAALSCIPIMGYAFSDTMFAKMAKEYLGIDFTKFDHRKILGQLIYRWTSTDEENTALDANQQELQDKYQNYLKSNGLTEDQMSMEEYKKKTKPTLWSKYGSPILHRIMGLGDRDDGAQPPSLYDRIKNGLDGLADWFNKLVKNIVNLSPLQFLKGIFGMDTDDSFGGKKGKDAHNAIANSAPAGLFSRMGAALGNAWNTATERVSNWRKYLFGGSGPGFDTGNSFSGGGIGDYIDTAKEKLSSAYNYAADKIHGIQNKNPFTGQTYDDKGNENTPSTIGDDSKNDEVNDEMLKGTMGETVGGHKSWLYQQNDSRFATKPAAPRANPAFSNMQDNGCAPTAMAMVASRLKDKWIDPIHTSMVATEDDVDRGYDSDGSIPGIKTSYFGRAASAFGLGYNEITNEKNSPADAINLLEKGYPLIFGGTDSNNSSDTPFTQTGHYVIANNVTRNGANLNKAQVQIIDPMGQKSGNYNMLDVMNASINSNGYIGAFSEDKKDMPEQQDRVNAKNKAKGKGKNKSGKGANSGEKTYSKGLLGWLDYFKDSLASVGLATFSGEKWKRLKLVIGDSKYGGGTGGGAGSTRTGLGGQVTGIVGHTYPIDHMEYTRGDNIIAAYDSDDKLLASYECRNDRVDAKGTVDDGTYENVNAIDPEEQTRLQERQFGCFYIRTNHRNEKGEATGRDIHGGGSGCKDPWAPRQGWCPTNGCLRMQNEDGVELSNSIIAAGNSTTLIVKDGNCKGDPSSVTGLKDGDDGPKATAEGGPVDPKFLYKKLKSLGYNDIAAAGILGNIEQESSFNTKDVPITHDAEGRPMGGFGLFQFNGDRIAALKKYAEDKGMLPTDYRAQLEFMAQESEDRKSTPDYGDTTPSGLKDFDNSEEVAEYFRAKYEGGTAGKRNENAKAMYSKIQAGDFAGSGLGNRRFIKRPNAAKNFKGSGFLSDISTAAKSYSDLFGSNPISKNIPGILSSAIIPHHSITRNSSYNNAGYGIEDLIDPLNKLDTHDELHQMIAYLKIIADKSYSSSQMSPDTVAEMDRNSRKARQFNQVRPANFEMADKLMNSQSELADTLSGDWNQAYQMAIRKKYK